jgi:hypothetical protein
VRPFAALTAVCLAALAGAFASTPASAVSSCGRAGYSYAGFQATTPAHGVRADIVALGTPQVESGHVAAWVGVGGPGQGAGGSDAWIQVGFASFDGTGSRLYFEVNRPGIGPRFTQVQGHVAPGSRHRVAVLEVFGHPGWWKVWADGAVVSQSFFLPGSSGRWRPIATAETWDGGRRVCNLFSYRFGHVTVAGRGGAWRRFHSGYRFQDPGYRVLGSRNGFLARAVRPLPHTPSATKAPEPTITVQPVSPADATEVPTAETTASDAPTTDAVDSPSS